MRNWKGIERIFAEFFGNSPKEAIENLPNQVIQARNGRKIEFWVDFGEFLYPDCIFAVKSQPEAWGNNRSLLSIAP
jgi:hypothetical protein